MAFYLLQEDGVSKITLEDGTGFILLEEAGTSQLRARIIRGNDLHGNDDYLISYQV